MVALERVMEINKAKKGDAGLKSLDLGDRPTFGFGNSSKDQCVSTAYLRPMASLAGFESTHSTAVRGQLCFPLALCAH